MLCHIKSYSYPLPCPCHFNQSNWNRKWNSTFLDKNLNFNFCNSIDNNFHFSFVVVIVVLCFLTFVFFFICNKISNFNKTENRKCLINIIGIYHYFANTHNRCSTILNFSFFLYKIIKTKNLSSNPSTN